MNLKATTKDWTKKILLRTRVLRLANQFVSPCAVILGYHSIQDRPELYANLIGLGITHATSVFERQMELIAREYSPVSLEEILLFLQGEKHLPKSAVAVTFDDGYRDNFEIADPILRRYGIPGAFYLTTSLIGTREAPWFCRLRHSFATTAKDEWSDPVRGQRWRLLDPKSRNAALQAAFDVCSSMGGDVCRAIVRTIEHELDVAPLALEKDLMMTWDQARKLHDTGHLVGSHTMTHPNVAHLSDEEIVRKELLESKRRVEVELDAPVEHFSYPHPALNPQWTQRTTEITRETGYQTAVTTTAGTVRIGSNPLQLTRVMVPRLEGQFRWALESAFVGRAT
jgi:peptidoglycan/xylan/chitin deacetylase (PgdA/CDA1 family)